jgi:alanine dehydrogenase
MTLLLTRADVEKVLTMREAIDAVEEGFRQLALGGVTMPQRTAIRIPEHRGLHLAMPAHIGGSGGAGGALATKIVTVYPDNPTRFDLPTTIGTLLLNDPRSGALLSIMDAGFLTAMRTGAVSGVASKVLAREDASIAGIFGAGVMARTQLRAVCEVRKILRAVVHDPNVEAATRYSKEMSAVLGIPVEPVGNPKDVLDADIVCAASSSKTPVFEGSWLRPGTHINGVGAHSPDAREIDGEAIRRSKVVTDFLPACLAEAGDLILAIKEGSFRAEQVHADLGEILAGSKTGRQSAEEITLFKSVGLAVQDAATAARVLDLARAAGVGSEIRV